MQRGFKQLCEHNEYSYAFSTSTENFALATKSCENINGLIASDLDNDAYVTINKCSSFAIGGHDYYIGLLGNRSRCKNPEFPFEWFKSRTCTDGSPLKDITPQDNRRCVIIAAQQGNNIPRAQVIDCGTGIRYICQTKTRSSATPTIQSMKFTSNQPTEMISNETASHSPTTVNEDLALNSFPIFNVVIGIAALLIFFGLSWLCFVLYKKGCLKSLQPNNKHVNSSNSDFKELRTNPLYDG